MAIQYNQISREGIANFLLTYPTGIGTTQLRIYPTSVAYPNAAMSGTLSSTGQLVPFNVSFQRTGSTLNFTGSVVTSVNAVAAGTIGWWGLGSTNGYVCSDSFGLSGSGKVLTVSSLTTTVGQPLIISFNLSVV